MKPDLLADLSDWFSRQAHAPVRLLRQNGQIQAQFHGVVLHSAFQALLRSENLAVHAHEALLRASDLHGAPLSPMEAFARCASSEETVLFDRLCRTVHLLNFESQNHEGQKLFLNVSGKHLLALNDGQHGGYFDQLLKHCHLRPHRIVLEILEAGVDDLQHLNAAVNTYKKRGYQVAIDDFGCDHSNFDRLWRLSPDIIKLDRSLVVEGVDNLRARRILPRLIDIIHDLGAQAVCEGIETPEQHQLAVDSGADMLQGYRYGMPQAHLLATLPPANPTHNHI